MKSEERLSATCLIIFRHVSWAFSGLAGHGQVTGRLPENSEVGIMILASVLALFYRAAIGSQKELKIMTVGATPPPTEAGVSGWVGAAGASGCSCFSRERLSAEFFQQKGVQTHLHKISIILRKPAEGLC